MKKNNLWFKAKRYGWGWYPITWQGWIVTLIFIFLIIFAPIKIEERPFLFLIWFGLITLGLIIVCKSKGEQPRWRWGK